MNIDDFSEPQKQSLLDLVILAMYADGHLAKLEDGRVHLLLGSLGFHSAFERDREYDAAVTRVSRHSETVATARAHAAKLASSFTTRRQRQTVQEILDDIVITDSHVSLQENNLLSVVSEELQK
jgi:6-phosphogluconolactonase/glucosamine-6-phosphate isomerase/deaminase